MSSSRSREAVAAFGKHEADQIMSTTGSLAHYPARFCKEILARSRLVTYPKGATIYRVEDEPSGIYGLVDGQLRLEMGVLDVGEQVAILAQPGAWLGAPSVIRRRPRALSLACASRSTLLFLANADFERLASNAENMRCFAQMAIENNDLILSFARDLMNSDIRARIASRLIAIFGGVGAEHYTRPIAITQAELAMVCNISRKTINQELAQLERMGVVSRAYRKLVVEDVAKLRRIADGEHAVRLPTKADEGERSVVH